MLFLWCPGCDSLHGVELLHPPTTWGWNSNLKTTTITPSILTHTFGLEDPRKCHAFVTEGQWIFLADSFHVLAGKTVGLVELPHWLETPVTADVT